jgi:hypothetical protein
MLKRIAPTILALAALPAVASKLTYHGGRLLTAPRYVNVYWGADWASNGVPPQLDQFVSVMAGSPDYNSALQEYAVAKYPIEPGSFAGGFVITSGLGTSVDDPQIRSFLDHQINSGALPPRTDTTVYVVYLPLSVSFSFAPGISGDAAGYHTVNQVSSTGGLVHYIVVLDGSTVTISHEMAETVTDPDSLDLSRGWYDDSNPVEGPFTGEIGDLCEGQDAVVAGYPVSTLWSNFRNGCFTQGIAPTGGGCPAGTADQNGVCVPDVTPIGCSTAGAGAAPFFGLFAAAIAAALRRAVRSSPA